MAELMRGIATFTSRHVRSRLIPVLLATIASGCAARPTAIVDVSVFPATGSTAEHDVTVLISGDRISAIGSDIGIPANARVIDGRGKFLIPGLWDMHVHLSKTRPSAMKLLVANGVTSIRDMGGDIDELLLWRDQVAAGDRVGPTIYTAGTYLESPENIARMLAKPVADNVEPVTRMRVGVANPAEARRVVGQLAARGVDLIKVRESIDDTTFVAIGRAARDNGLALMGHTMEVPLEQIVAAQVGSIEHFFIPFLDDVPVERRQQFFADLAAMNAAFVPNLHLFVDSEQTPNAEILAFLDDQENELDPRRALLSRYMLKDWREQLEQDRTEGRKAFFRRLMPSLMRDIREMRAAGVTILPGTDTAVVFVFPGWALHEELVLYVDLLGFTPAEAIIAATRDAAAFMGVSDQVGTIETGKRADLLLLKGDPLADIRNTRNIDSVILGGQVFSRSELEELLESVSTEPDVIRDDWGRYPPVD